MSRVAVDTDWLHQIEGLTIQPAGEWPQDQIVAARMRVVRLVRAARPVASSSGATAACPPAAATLARELAVADVPEMPRPEDTEEELADAYLDALSDAAGAVYFCRRVEHASGGCWFSAEGPEADVCGRVLAVGHRCSSPRQPNAATRAPRQT
ncbi:MAG TPA: hypothetical protein VM287_01300 [Egibacteraceae bacterium]|nr:hypothetical protein [Egibacteraceae bacterium]